MMALLDLQWPVPRRDRRHHAQRPEMNCHMRLGIILHILDRHRQSRPVTAPGDHARWLELQFHVAFGGQDMRKLVGMTLCVGAGLNGLSAIGAPHAAPFGNTPWAAATACRAISASANATHTEPMQQAELTPYRTRRHRWTRAIDDGACNTHPHLFSNGFVIAHYIFHNKLHKVIIAAHRQKKWAGR
ncbi:hypothetical protein PX699_26175 [Sphingobium sp. H39-3-25]|uniref:hypothetical protein n=1 Tax=Sphingobium arseniciresistens TaxID=3030834 RepID=UPI0023B8FAA1|nr:hypothetical protein [Sphingobium arseniciresistens]